MTYWVLFCKMYLFLQRALLYNMQINHRLSLTSRSNNSLPCDNRVDWSNPMYCAGYRSPCKALSIQWFPLTCIESLATLFPACKLGAIFRSANDGAIKLIFNKILRVQPGIKTKSECSFQVFEIWKFHNFASFHTSYGFNPVHGCQARLTLSNARTGQPIFGKIIHRFKYLSAR